MAEEVQNAQQTEQKPNDKELNFRQLEAKYERQLAAERAEKERLQQELQERSRMQQTATEEDDDDSEPYVDKKRLDKKFSYFERKLDEKIEKKAEEKARNLLQNERRENWIKDHPDFYDVMQHAEKLVQKSPMLAETILKMPDGFERQQLVYANIKTLGLDKPEVKQPSIQEKIDANRRSPYYQPSGIASPGYETSGDFSASGQKSAYAKMKELQQRMRL